MEQLTHLQEDQNFQEFLQQNPAVQYLNESQIVELFKEWVTQRTYQTLNMVQVPSKVLELLWKQMSLIEQMVQHLNPQPSLWDNESNETTVVQPSDLEEYHEIDPFWIAEDIVKKEVASLSFDSSSVDGAT